MKDFLIIYWKELAEGLIAIITLLVVLLKKRGKLNPALESLLLQLPLIIKKVEQKYGSGNGEVKLEYVFRYCQTYLSDFYNIKNLDPYAKYISDKVDEILSCPQKKGV